MPQNFQFGGGAGGSSMHPVVLVATLLAALLLLFLPRKYALAPVLTAVFLTPFGAELDVAGFHLYVFRILILLGWLRLLGVKIFSGRPLFGSGLGLLEKTFFLWAFFRAVTFMLLFRTGGAVAYQMGFCLDAYGGYILLRHLVQERADVVRAIKILSAITSLLAVSMLCEYLTRFNLFSYIGMMTVSWVRDGKVRAQGVFANSITAGTFGAVLTPLFFFLFRSNKAKLWGGVALISSTALVLTSVASTGLMAYMGGILALFLWPIRKRMRSIRWSIVFAMLALSLLMKAPVWFLVARVDVIGGSHGWDRAILIDQTIRHFPDWWLLGSKDNATWGADTWDACNQFVAEATGGGLVSLALFIAILSQSFGMIGRARERAEGDLRSEWFFWSLGAALFSNVVGFIGIDYFDQTRVLWFLFLVMISVATVDLSRVAVTETQEVVGHYPLNAPVFSGASFQANKNSFFRKAVCAKVWPKPDN